MNKLSILIIFLFIVFNTTTAQNSIEGHIRNTDGIEISNAKISITSLNLYTTANSNGYYLLNNIPEGNYILSITANNYKTVTQEVTFNTNTIKQTNDVVLNVDYLELSSVVIVGDKIDPKSKLLNSNDITTISNRNINTPLAEGTAGILSSVPGIYADASTGEVFTRVYSRGISISAEDDLGWYYVSLEEDGMPVSSVQFNSFSPDLFFRSDITMSKLEVLNGGKSSIVNSNSPGATFNFISKTGHNNDQILITSGIEGDGNIMYRLDGLLSGKIDENWTYNLGGFFRNSEGARNTDGNWSRGGQIKLNLNKTFSNGYFRIYGKYLNDKVNRYTGVAATNWNDPKAAFGQDFKSTSLLLPSLNTQIADGRSVRNNSSASNDFDPNDGIKTIDYTIGAEIFKQINKWSIKNNIKISHKSATWNTLIGNQPIGLEQFTPYLLNGISPDFSVLPLGNVVFRDINTGQVIAGVNNFGILDENPSFEYTQGSLPFDAVMGTAPWLKEDELTEVMNRFFLKREFGKHHLTLGSFLSYSDVTSFTSGSYAYATYENNPRMLYVTLENDGEEIIELSDRSGISNYGGLFYNNAKAKVFQSSIFIDDEWSLSDEFVINTSLAYTIIDHDGSKDRYEPTPDLDNNLNTAYNNSTLSSTGVEDDFNYTYHNISASLGIQYLFNETTSAFGRFTLGNKAPELNYYFDNFQNVPVEEKGTTQRITQTEVGIKLQKNKYSLLATGFWSVLSNVGFSEFVFDESNGSLFYTPMQFNKTSTVGLTLEGVYSGINHFPIKISTTVQNPIATKYTIYNANGTADINDDTVLDYSKNTVPHNPKFTFSIQPSYIYKKLEVFAKWNYTGEREGNIANAFQLPEFNTTDFGVSYNVNSSLQIKLLSNNIFNNKGLMNFYGPNEFGSNSNAATKSYIDANPNASFVVFPIMPRTIYLKFGWVF